MGAMAQPAAAQQKPEKPDSPVHLELITEVAATTEDGLPAALRITLKNAGNIAVDLPMLQSDCKPEGGVGFHFSWRSSDDREGVGNGYGCAADGHSSFLEHVRRDWIRLQPGEFLCMSENLRGYLRDLKPGTVEYWVQFVPSSVKPEDLLLLQSAGYVVPTENIEGVHYKFAVH